MFYGCVFALCFWGEKKGRFGGQFSYKKGKGKNNPSGGNPPAPFTQGSLEMRTAEKSLAATPQGFRNSHLSLKFSINKICGKRIRIRRNREYSFPKKLFLLLGQSYFLSNPHQAFVCGFPTYSLLSYSNSLYNYFANITVY